MRSVRGLLVQGNRKIGAAIHHFDLPAILTCPGRSAVCEQVCYATQGRFRFRTVQARLQWCYERSQRPDFVTRMVREIRRKGVLVVRIHVSGDFYSAAYAEKWLNVMRQCPRVRYYWYSRSWRVPEVGAVLEQMAALRCCRAWYSVDCATGLPERMPKGVRLAYLQDQEGQAPEHVDLLFVVRRWRRQAAKLALPMLCPHEVDKAETCGFCGKCWR